MSATPDSPLLSDHGDGGESAWSPDRARRKSLNDRGPPGSPALWRRHADPRWSIRRSSCGKNLRAGLCALLLSLTASGHLGYALGLGPAVAEQLFPSVLPEAAERTRVFCLTCVYLGCALGALVGGICAQRWGRRTALLLASPVGILGWTVFAAARDGGWRGGSVLAELIIGRLLVGVSAGMSSVNVPVYIAEMSPTRWRGALVSVHQIGIGVGFTLAYLVGWEALDDSDPEEAASCWLCGWRLAGWLGTSPLVFSAPLVYVLPETPRWSAFRGDSAGARSGLTTLRGEGQPSLLEAELAAILAASTVHQHPVRTTWRKTAMPTRIAVAVVLALTTQLAGGFDSFITPMEIAKLEPGLEALGLGRL